MKNKILAAFLLAALCAGCKKEKDSDVVVIQASGDISSQVNAFRQILGSTLNTAPGAVGGRREINWDGVPPSLLGKPLPPNFMNNTDPGALPGNQRGLVYEAGANLQVSDNNFSEVNPQASAEFAAFSGSQVFTNIASNLWDVGFEIPGQDVPASVRGFGIVFADVDLENNTSLEFFNGSKSLGKFYAPVQKNGSKFSFLGVYFKQQRITRIKVQHGNGLLNAGEKDITNGGTKDLVILDDFLYDEPVKQ
ncbi:MAG TPA: hypothetical protein VD993_13340 [Chitinophagaceae bacterium]|nr:hypothetical protein [Chitinophagaceae bacterium]